MANAPVKIGHARSSSKPRPEQVAVTNWYNGNDNNSGPWNTVMRFNDHTKALQLAQLIKEACDNDNIYYTQDVTQMLRKGVYRNAANGIRPRDIVTDGGCDCTSLVEGCLKYMGIECWGSPAKQYIFNTGLFTKFTDDAHCKSNTLLRVGDIIARDHHMAVVIYSEYDNLTPEYVDIPDTERNQQWGRLVYTDPVTLRTEIVMEPFNYSERTETPKKPQDWSDIEWFMFGAALVGCRGKFSDIDGFSNISFIHT